MRGKDMRVGLLQTTPEEAGFSPAAAVGFS